MADLDERVLVVPRAEVEALAGPGFTRCGYSKFEAVLASPSCRYAPRREVEEDPAWLQPIPYTLLRHRDLVFSYRRGAAGGEGRLLGRRSLGVGGHVAEDDAGGKGAFDAFCVAAVRELREEVDVHSGFLYEALGLILDDSDPVGRVHLGMAQVVVLDVPDAKARGPEIADAGFVPVASLAGAREEYESWSKILIDRVFAN